VAKGASRDFNPSLPQATVDRALKRDHAKASAEYLGEFRTDLENFVDFETVQACVGEHLELPRGGFQYRAFCDAAGGSGGDSFTLAIGHRESDDRVFIDAIRETRPPFSPMQVIDDYAALLKSYGIARVSGDRFSGGFASEQFHRRGISYQPTTMFKSDLYRDLLPLLNSGRIVLPRSDRLINQICSLERKIGRSGKDSISHPEREHDDVANAVAGVANLLVGGQGCLSPHLVDRCFTDEVQPIFKDWEGPSQWLH